MVTAAHDMEVTARDAGRSAVQVATAARNEAKVKVDAAQSAMDIANGRITRVGGRASATPVRYSNNDAVNAAEKVLFDSNDEWKITKGALVATKESKNGSEAKYLEWTTKFPHQTKEALLLCDFSCQPRN